MRKILSRIVSWEALAWSDIKTLQSFCWSCKCISLVLSVLSFDKRFYKYWSRNLFIIMFDSCVSVLLHCWLYLLTVNFVGILIAWRLSIYWYSINESIINNCLLHCLVIRSHTVLNFHEYFMVVYHFCYQKVKRKLSVRYFLFFGKCKYIIFTLWKL